MRPSLLVCGVVLAFAVSAPSAQAIPELTPLQQANLAAAQGICSANGGQFLPQGPGGLGGYVCDDPTARSGVLLARIMCGLVRGQFALGPGSKDFECLLPITV
jgi:hypothetical protein